MRLLTMVGLLVTTLAAACDRAQPDASSGGGPPGEATSAASQSPATSTTDAPARGETREYPAVPAATNADVWREFLIPEGTSLPLVLDTTVSSATSRVEEAVQAHLSRAVTVDGVAVLPEGSRVHGAVTDARESAKVKGRARVAVRFTTITLPGTDESYSFDAAPVARTAPATKKKDAVTIGAPAAGGAIVGGIIGGKKGAAIGTAAGGGAGTAVVLSTRGEEVHLAKGSALTVKLTHPLPIKVRG